MIYYLSYSEKESNQESSTESGSLTEFHQLILLRILRPDRLPIAMSRYVSEYLNVESEQNLTLDQLLETASERHCGILVLLPNKDKNLPDFVETNSAQIVSNLAAVSENCLETNALRGRNTHLFIE